MPHTDARTLALDPESTAVLRDGGLRLEQVSNADGAEFSAFLSAVARGFLDPVPTAAQIADSREALQQRRLAAVYDDAAPAPQTPVATIDSWATELTTSPGRLTPLWAISAVTVAPTHRRRGIARALLTGELRAAAAAGFALAGLTVSEATIYGRWGFAPAAYTADVTIDTARARYLGPRPSGRLDFVDQGEVPDLLGAVRDRERMLRPGEVDGWPGLWRRIAGLRPEDPDGSKVRAVAYSDGGDVRGVLVYVIREDDDAPATLSVRILSSADDEAAAALWRFVLEHDLVGTVRASLQPVDSALRWMIADQRALRAQVTDHHWLRVLDVPAALAARAYAAPLDVVLRVTDELGLADGTWRFSVDATGAGSAEASEADPAVVVPVDALAAMLLGGTAPSTLRAAGRLAGDAEAVRGMDRAFAAERAPVLGIWY